MQFPKKTGIVAALAGLLLLAGVFALAAAAQDKFGLYSGGNLFGGYLGTYADDWWFDVYGIDSFDFYENGRGLDADEDLEFFGERAIAWGWMDQRLYYSGVYRGKNRADDWFFDAYVDAGENSFWHLASSYP